MPAVQHYRTVIVVSPRPPIAPAILAAARQF
jgi:hypothetical protein